MLSSKTRSSLLAGGVWSLLVVVGAGATLAAAEQQSDQDQAALDARIAILIEQLGTPQFATREKAQAELAELGFAAFDALREAQDHEDVEIALRAQYLIRRLRFDWTREGDPPQVKKILKDYQHLDHQKRLKQMYALSELDEELGIGALCRLVRYEKSEILSKEAALLIMAQAGPEDSSRRQSRSQTILSAIGRSKPTAAQWLRAYVQSLEDSVKGAAAWQRLAVQEQQLFTQFPEKTSQRFVWELLRRQIAILEREDRDDEARDVMRRMLDLTAGDSRELYNTVSWLIERRAWQLVEESATRFAGQFDQDALLLYLLAEARAKQGDEPLSETTAQRAFKLEEHRKPSHHVEVALKLRDRGMFSWSEREYRHIVDQGASASLDYLRATSLLSEMLHDNQQDQAAAVVLEGLAEAIDKDRAVQQLVRKRREPGAIKARMHYFHSQHYAALNDRKMHVQHLEKALEHDETDADVIIAMYRLPDQDAKWRDRTVTLIEKAGKKFRSEIDHWQQFRRRVIQEGDAKLRGQVEALLASANNQFAWLIGNTAGDYDEALRRSKKSLELRPATAAYFDTLARCYYAKGDFENAVKFQAQAVEGEPYSGQIRRQFEQFELALAESKVKAAADKIKTGDDRDTGGNNSPD